MCPGPQIDLSPISHVEKDLLRLPADEETCMAYPITLTVKKSTTSLQCLISYPTDASVNITAAAYDDGTGAAATACTVAGDGQSFQLPIGVVGTFNVDVQIDNNPAPGVLVSAGTAYVLMVTSPATNGGFGVQVTL
jgi:hypothetical protein